MADEEMQLLQGTLDVMVLKTLAWGPRHGYAVGRWLEETAGTELRVEDRAIYIALHRMEQRGWVEAEWGVTENNRRAKYYRLTRGGRKQLEAQARRWGRYAAAVTKVLQAAG